ncbi:Fasciclin-like arabinogalactan protein 14-like protein [Drosera capensis]
MANFLALSLPFILVSLLSNPTTGFNITEILSDYSDFSTFNSYLTQSQIVSDINSQGTITVLAVSNSNISSMSDRSADVLKKILEVHILLDYYGPEKLKSIANSSVQTTTLFQRSGVAINQQGFINITISSTGDDITFRSSAPGSSSSSTFIKSVTSQPYNISVLQISAPIIPAGIDNSTASPSPPPFSPSPSPSASSPSASPSASSPSPATQPPQSSPPPAKTPSPSPLTASPPSPVAPAPGTVSPTPTPEKSVPAPGGADDGEKSGAGAIRVCAVLIAIVAVIVVGVVTVF